LFLLHYDVSSLQIFFSFQSSRERYFSEIQRNKSDKRASKKIASAEKITKRSFNLKNSERGGAVLIQDGTDYFSFLKL